jgi:hypothetical protein
VANVSSPPPQLNVKWSITRLAKTTEASGAKVKMVRVDQLAFREWCKGRGSPPQCD